MITVRIAHAEPWPGRLGTGGQSADLRMLSGRRGEFAVRSSLVVLADDAGGRALPVWLAEDPDRVSLPVLADWYGDDSMSALTAASAMSWMPGVMVPASGPGSSRATWTSATGWTGGRWTAVRVRRPDLVR
jgi:hypothetical protein